MGRRTSLFIRIPLIYYVNIANIANPVFDYLLIFSFVAFVLLMLRFSSFFILLVMRTRLIIYYIECEYGFGKRSFLPSNRRNIFQFGISKTNAIFTQTFFLLFYYFLWITRYKFSCSQRSPRTFGAVDYLYFYFFLFSQVVASRWMKNKMN